MLDHWYFREIYRLKKHVFVLDARVHHNLSVEEFEANMTPVRYSRILNSERAFFREDPLIGRTAYKIRLLFRLVKQMAYSNRNYLRMSFNALIGHHSKNEI